MSGEEASEEAGKCSGAELVSLVRAKLDMVKERCVGVPNRGPQLASDDATGYHRFDGAEQLLDPCQSLRCL